MLKYFYLTCTQRSENVHIYSFECAYEQCTFIVVMYIGYVLFSFGIVFQPFLCVSAD